VGVRRGLVALMLAYMLTATGAAGQEAAVRGAITETLAAWGSGDFATFADSYQEDSRGFFLDGGVLVEGVDVQALQLGYDAGLRADFTVRDLQVRIVSGVAISAAYLDGALTLPGGLVRSGTWRYTETRVEEGGSWKVVQFHFSDMTATAR
jgi:ketosteroid isomerase-like protein